MIPSLPFTVRSTQDQARAITTGLSSGDSSKEVLEETGKSGERAVLHSAAAEIWPYSWSPYSWTYLSCSWEKFWKRITRESMDFGRGLQENVRTNGSSSEYQRKPHFLPQEGKVRHANHHLLMWVKPLLLAEEKKWEWEVENLKGQEEWGLSNVGLLLTGHCLATLCYRFYLRLKVTY